jgi:hypothetical protein
MTGSYWSAQLITSTALILVYRKDRVALIESSELTQIFVPLSNSTDVSVSLFDNPTLSERLLYTKYWQNKLHNNKDIDFPDSLAKDVATMTDKFSFAYLKECL